MTLKTLVKMITGLHINKPDTFFYTDKIRDESKTDYIDEI